MPINNLPSVQDLDVRGKIVFLRADLDVPVSVRVVDGVKEVQVTDESRLQAAVPTIKLLLQKGARHILVAGHMGRYQDQGGISTFATISPLSRLLDEGVSYWPDLIKENKNELFKVHESEPGKVHLLENLRFYKGEDDNDPEFAQVLASLAEIYVNDAFATSHRTMASIVSVPKLLPHAAGLHLLEEVENLSKILENPRSPVVVVLGGGKMDKALLVDKLLDHTDWLLVGGILPQKIKSYCRESDGKMCVSAAHLTHDGKDITPDSARNFVEIIKGAGTIVWNGPMGDIDNNFWEGTEIVADAIAKSRGFKVVGGGDTIHALQKLGILETMGYISTGGGAMIEFLAYGDLPGLAALKKP